MAVNAPIGATWTAPRPSTSGHEARVGHAEGRAERVASWLVTYLAALLTSLAVGGSVWALGLIG